MNSRLFTTKSLTAAVVLSLLIILSLPAASDTLVVAKKGTQYSSIQAAIDAAQPGDTVRVRKGTYKENLSINKDLTLKGVGASKVKIDGQIEAHPVLRIGPSEVKVTVKNLTLQGAEGDSCKVLEKGLCSFGLAAVGDSALRVIGAIISGNASGIWLQDSSRAIVKTSKISGNDVGILLKDSSRATVQNNYIRKNKVGIDIDKPKKFNGILEGSGNRIVDNNTGFVGVTEPTREELISSPKKTDSSKQPDSATRLARANNDFGFRLLNELMPDGPKENIFISPLSIQLALQMTYMGARGGTKKGMEEVLGLTGLEKEEVAERARQLLNRLNDTPGKIDLSVANSIWAREGVSFKKDFLEDGEKYYGAKIEELDFSSPKAVKRINDWVADRTHGRIKRIVKRLNPLDVMVLINALYFKGPWQNKFIKMRTRKEPFFLPDGSKKELPLMEQTEKFQYLEKENFQLIRLPYGDNGKLAAYVALPREEYGLEALISQLSWRQWQSWRSQMERKKGKLALPRFKLRYEKKLNKPLQALGMKLAFAAKQADFSGIIDLPKKNAYISKVKHKTFLEVTEKGTEAAAATSAKIVLSARLSPDKFEMIVDHPFLFAIADEETDALLFVGGIWEPERIEDGK